MGPEYRTEKKLWLFLNTRFKGTRAWHYKRRAGGGLYNGKVVYIAQSSARTGHVHMRWDVPVILHILVTWRLYQRHLSPFTWRPGPQNKGAGLMTGPVF